MDQSVADEYKSSLNDLNFNSKPLINMLTMLAEENKKHASSIVNAIISHIDSVSSESKLPGLYLVDSILKNIGNEYLKIFCECITSLFSTVFEKVDENTRSLMFKLRQTWTDILPNKVLHNLDVSVKKIDPAWPITAKFPLWPSIPKNPSKKILINPKFLDGSVAQKPQIAASSITAEQEDKIKQQQQEEKIKQQQQEKIEQEKIKQQQEEKIKQQQEDNIKKQQEDKIKQQQEEVLKQLLAKQEELRQLEFKNIQMAMKKKMMQNPVRDPRLLKIYNVSAMNTNPKSFTSNCDMIPSVSLFSTEEKATVPTNINDGKDMNNISSEQSIQVTNELPISLQKVSQKYKKEKVSSNQNKSNVFNDKLETSCKSKESSINLFNTDESCKNEVDFAKINENYPKDINKGFINISKKKSSDRNKISLGSLNANIDTMKKKVSCFPKKKERLKTLLHLEAALKKKKELKTDMKNRCIRNEDLKIKKDVSKLEKTRDLPKTVLLNEEFKSKGAVKHEIVTFDSVIKVNEDQPPRKKNKTEDIENYNPDFRNHSPVLFGFEDQDLRQPKTHDIKSKDWSQYKVSHPDQYRTGRGRHECNAEKFGSQKFHFSDFHHHPFQYGRSRFFRHSRGRYISGRNARRIHFPRNFRGQYFYNSPIHPVTFDSHTFLQQAEEKYNSGRISEVEYLDLRRDLQNVAQTSEFQCSAEQWSNMQNNYHLKRNQEIPKLREEYKNEIYSIDNLRIQEPSEKLPTVKPFILDDEEKCIHFIEDKAFVLTNNKEPVELTFKNEEREVYIEGVANPIALSFDGNSMEFEAHGQMHFLRLGIPGRELYINNHPYEAQFGGPPIAVRLENGHVYKIHLSGPPPQVVIGNKPQFELFAEYHGNIETSVFKHEPDYTSERKHPKMDFKTPESCSVLDIDMRMLPKNIQHADTLLNDDSPFYSKDMKDVDWRHIPPCSNLEADRNLPRIFDDDMSRDFETWTGEDQDNRTAFRKEQNNQFQDLLPNDSSTYKWERSEHFENSNVAIPFHEENWNYKEQDKVNWEYNDYSKSNALSHCEEPFSHTMENQSPSNTTENLPHEIEQYGTRSHSYNPYLKRSSENKQTRNQEDSTNYESWAPNIDTDLRHNESVNPMQTIFSSVSQRALLVSPTSSLAYPSPASTSYLHETTTTALSVVPDKLAHGLSCSTTQFGSKIKQPQSGSSETVDVQSLFEKLISAGIINSKQSEPIESSVTPLSEIRNVKEIDTSIEVPEIKLTSESLKIHYTGVISALHNGLQCETCGIRFMESQSDQYSQHLDWHFRMNRKDKDSSKKAISRRWFYEVVDWIQFEELEDIEERVPSYFELQVGEPEPEVVEVPTVISVCATNDEQEACPVCNEKFQLFWVEEEEEWHFRDAVRHDKVVYHPSCYEDFKKTIVTKSNTVDISDATEDVSNVLNDVLIKIATESEIQDEIVPCVNVEEELLEGKPGEEEIIGVISESDMETELDIPTVDSKIIVMQSGGITLKVKAESLQCNLVGDSSDTETKMDEDNSLVEEEIDFRPPTPDPNFEVRPLVSRGRELSGLCCIM